MLHLNVGDDLSVSLGDATVRLTPAEGLDFAEEIARKSFRQALAEEAEGDARTASREQQPAQAARPTGS